MIELLDHSCRANSFPLEYAVLPVFFEFLNQERHHTVLEQRSFE